MWTRLRNLGQQLRKEAARTEGAMHGRTGADQSSYSKPRPFLNTRTSSQQIVTKFAAISGGAPAHIIGGEFAEAADSLHTVFHRDAVFQDSPCEGRRQLAEILRTVEPSGFVHIWHPQRLCDSKFRWVPDTPELLDIIAATGGFSV